MLKGRKERGIEYEKKKVSLARSTGIKLALRGCFVFLARGFQMNLHKW
jgi:hypothetical protein